MDQTHCVPRRQGLRKERAQTGAGWLDNEVTPDLMEIPQPEGLTD